jgi:hypothetical protein
MVLTLTHSVSSKFGEGNDPILDFATTHEDFLLGEGGVGRHQLTDRKQINESSTKKDLPHF